MTDENTELNANDDQTKKASASTKKIKPEKSKSTDKSVKKKKVIEKLKAMGVIRSGKSNVAEDSNAEHANIFKLTGAVVLVVVAVGSLVLALNKDVTKEQVALHPNNVQQANNSIIPGSYPGRWHPSAYNNNTPYSREQQERVQQQQAQQNNWRQHYQEAQQQQLRAQQQKWAQQQQHALQQYQIQQQKWAQQQIQQPHTYYGYPAQYGGNGTSAATYYNYQSGYQHPGPYYRR